MLKSEYFDHQKLSNIEKHPKRSWLIYKREKDALWFQLSELQKVQTVQYSTVIYSKSKLNLWCKKSLHMFSLRKPDCVSLIIYVILFFNLSAITCKQFVVSIQWGEDCQYIFCLNHVQAQKLLLLVLFLIMSLQYQIKPLLYPPERIYRNLKSVHLHLEPFLLLLS